MAACEGARLLPVPRLACQRWQCHSKRGQTCSPAARRIARMLVRKYRWRAVSSAGVRDVLALTLLNPASFGCSWARPLQQCTPLTAACHVRTHGTRRRHGRLLVSTRVAGEAGERVVYCSLSIALSLLSYQSAQLRPASACTPTSAHVPHHSSAGEPSLRGRRITLNMPCAHW